MREITRTVLKFLAGFLLVLLLSAFLAPWLYSFLPFKFDRILRRLIMIGTILLVLWLLRARRESLDRLGLKWARESLPALGKGFFLGVVIVAAVSLAQLAMGARIWRIHETDVWHWIGFFFKGLGAGMLIGLIEEFFFRGFLFLTLKDLWNTKISLVVTNLIYALVHFFPKGRVPIEGSPTVTDSFRILAAVVQPSNEWIRILPAILGLFLFGLILSFAFLRYGSLFPSIGIHAGAIFSLKLNRRFIPDVSEKIDWISGSKNLYDGITGLTVLALTCLFICRDKGSHVSKSRIRGKCFALLLILPLLLNALPARAEEENEELPTEGVVYSFVQELPGARAVREKKGERIQGMWEGDRINFEDLPEKTSILAKNNTWAVGKNLHVIWFQPLISYESSLIFSRVPPGRRLHLFFASPDYVFKQVEKPTPVQFEVWMGKKKLFETQLATKGWKEKTIDLTLPLLLQRSYVLTFKVWTAETEWNSLIFYGYIANK